MKGLKTLILLTCLLNIRSVKSQISSTLTPNPIDTAIHEGHLDIVFDQLGKKYKLDDIRIQKTNALTGVQTTPPMLCTTNSGYFNLYFEAGCGMDGATQTDIDRRNVICQVFADISAFISSPLNITGNKVNILVGNLNPLLPGYTSWGNPLPAASSGVLGLAKSFHCIPYNYNSSNISRISDNEIWKTIHAGSDSYQNVSSPLVPTGNGTFYHGLVAFNFDNINNIQWNLDLNNPTFPNGLYDLYTVALHEVTHALGFHTFISSNGTSIFNGLYGYNYYSRYDLFLRDNSGLQNLITNTGSCSLYDYQFNTNVPLTAINPGGCIATSSSNHTAPGSAATYIGSANVPVYTPNCFEDGSSLSHFEDELYINQNTGLPYGNDNYFVMSNANGPNVMKRFLTPEERLVLCDIGYNTNNTFGSIANNNLKNYTEPPCAGLNVGGINDGLNPNGTYIFTGDVNTLININGVLDNDYLGVIPTSPPPSQAFYECLSIVKGTGSLSNTTGSGSFQYTPTSPGHHLLSYVPVAPNGDRGNITYIYVFASVPSCSGICNLVANGNFEQNTGLPTGYSDIYKACGWQDATYSGTADYFHTNSPSGSFQIPCNVFGDQSDNSGLQAYAGMWFQPGGGENIYTKLITGLLPNTSYLLKMDVSLADGVSAAAFPIQAYLGTNTPIIGGSFPFNINNPSMLFTSAPVTNSGGWTTLTFNFTTTSGGEQYLTIGNINNNYSPNTAGAPTGCNYMNYNGPNLQASYYYIDNVSLLPTNNISINASATPNTVCPLNQPVTLNATSNGGSGAVTFNWQPVNVSGNPITVNPAISTNYVVTGTDANGCQATANILVNVVPITINLSTTINNFCNASTNIIPSGATTYILQPGGLSSNGTPFVVNPTVPTVYTIYGTDINGCTGSAQITINPIGNVSQCVNDHMIGTNITIPVGSSFNANGTYTGYNFTCLGNIIVPSNMTANFKNCTFMMGPGTQINMGLKSTLNIDNSHLYGCTSMWEGIRMQGQVGGNLTLTKTVLEDAFWGIWVPAAGATNATNNFPNKVKVSNCLFNTNYIDINYNNNITNTIDVNNTIFTSRCLNYDPPTLGATIPNNFTNIPYVQANIVPAPFTAPLPHISGNVTTYYSNPYVGLKLNRFSSNNLPGTGNQISLTTRNIFDYHTIGIETLNFSNLKIENQVFANGLGNAFTDKTGYGNIGIYAHNINWTVSNNAYIGNVTIGGNAAATNSFVALDYGIYALGGGTADSRYIIRNNDFRQIRQNGITFYSYGSLVNTVPTRLIQNNTFREINAWGIYMLNSVTTYAIISVNDFVNPGAPSIYTKYGGIYIGEIKNPTTAKYLVNQNTMNRMVTGIKGENLAQLTSNYNTIQLSPQNNINSNLGFHLINCQKPNLTRNDVTGNTTASNINIDQGMYVLDCPSGSYTCNKFKNTYVGSQFSGQNISTTLFENTYDYNLAGIYLTKQGFIDVQDDPIYPGQPVDNKFLNYGTGQYNSYCATTSGMPTFGNLSPFYIRSTGNYNMTNNGFDLISFPLQINTVASPLPQTNSFCYGGPNNPINRITNMANQIVNPGIYNAALVRDNNISRRQLYKVLENIATPNSTLTAFKNSAVNNSIGQFATIDSLTTEFSNTGNTGKLMQAQSLNSSVSSTTTVDGYQKQLNVLFMSYLTNNTLSTSEIGQLQNIATLCPHTDGTSVWEARTFIKLFDSTEYMNVCEQLTFPTALNNTSRMAMPSVSETVDAQIKGQLIPNPNNGNFSIVMNENIQDLKAEVYDVNGKLVCSNTTANNNRIDILCSELTNGVYFVKVFVNNTYNETHRLIITK